MKINYNKTVQFNGRNGIFKQVGLEIDDMYNTNNFLTSQERLRIFPITSKGITGSGWLEIPRENINELIEELKKFI